MSKACILLADDEPDLVWAVQRSLLYEGYEVLVAGDGLEALAVARRHSPALVILDIVMPNLDGLEVCRRMRNDPALATTPIIFLTDRSAITDRMVGLDEGGDDYLVKPFDLKELKARVGAMLRRSAYPPHVAIQHLGEIPPAGEQAPTISAEPAAVSFILDLHSRQLKIGGKVIELTPTEFDFLYFLMTHPGKVFTAKQLLQLVWSYPPGTADPGLVRWHVKNLRAKIEPEPDHPRFILTVPRQGYTLNRRQA